MTAQTDNKSLKNARIIFWVSTTIYVLFDSAGALFFNSQLAIDGIRHVGFPDYFRIELSLGKILGGVILIVPAIPARLKEWAYVGFGISLISAFIAHLVIDGIGQALMPVVVFAILLVSYIYFHKLQDQKP